MQTTSCDRVTGFILSSAVSLEAPTRRAAQGATFQHFPGPNCTFWRQTRSTPPAAQTRNSSSLTASGVPQDSPTSRPLQSQFPLAGSSARGNRKQAAAFGAVGLRSAVAGQRITLLAAVQSPSQAQDHSRNAIFWAREEGLRKAQGRLPRQHSEFAGITLVRVARRRRPPPGSRRAPALCVGSVGTPGKPVRARSSGWAYGSRRCSSSAARLGRSRSLVRSGRALGSGAAAASEAANMVNFTTYGIAAITLGGLAAVLLSAASVVAVGVALQPRWLLKIVRRGLPHILFDHVTQAPMVALTIDDGPNGATSHQLLDILQQNGCRATFFLIGSNMDKFPELVARMNQEGHELGNHTMEDVASWRLTPAEFEKALLQMDQKLQPYFKRDEGGRPVKWFRPGHGWYTKRIRRTVQDHGYRLALGSVYPVDPLFKEKGGPIAQYCLWKIYPGAVIVLHDRPQQENQTIEVLSKMLPELKRRGYEVVTLTELTQSKH